MEPGINDDATCLLAANVNNLAKFLALPKSYANRDAVPLHGLIISKNNGGDAHGLSMASEEPKQVQ